MRRKKTARCIRKYSKTVYSTRNISYAGEYSHFFSEATKFPLLSF
jgi:hypothetical protein